MTLLDALFSVLRAAAGMFVVLGVWSLLQAFVRRRSGCRNPDKDVLEFMLHGCCGNCHHKE